MNSGVRTQPALDALLKRVEEAAAPDWKLDAEIAVALQCTAGYKPEDGDKLALNKHYEIEVRDSDSQLIMLPQTFRYTASVDAAVALLAKAAPEITAWELRSRGGLKRFVAELCKLRVGHERQEVCFLGRSDQPAPAMCAAILRAALSALQEP